MGALAIQFPQLGGQLTNSWIRLEHPEGSEKDA
jgi:hypothetical protein